MSAWDRHRKNGKISNKDRHKSHSPWFPTGFYLCGNRNHTIQWLGLMSRWILVTSLDRAVFVGDYIYPLCFDVKNLNINQPHIHWTCIFGSGCCGSLSLYAEERRGVGHPLCCGEFLPSKTQDWPGGAARHFCRASHTGDAIRVMFVAVELVSILRARARSTVYFLPEIGQLVTILPHSFFPQFL